VPSIPPFLDFHADEMLSRSFGRHVEKGMDQRFIWPPDTGNRGCDKSEPRRIPNCARRKRIDNNAN